MRILITGVSGQVGSTLVPALKAIGAVRVKMSKSDIRKNKSRFRCSIDLRPRKFPAGMSAGGRSRHALPGSVAESG